MAFDPDAFLAEPAAPDPKADGGASGGFDPDAFLATDKPAAEQTPARSFLQRGWDSIKRGATAVGNVAADQAQFASRALLDPEGTFGTQTARDQAKNDFLLTNPAKRRELERGVGDVVTLGYANKAAEAADRASGQNLMSPEQQAKDAEEAPDYRTAGQIAGTALPNPLGKAIGALGKGAATVAGKIAPGAVADVANLVSKAPLASGVAKSVASYEAQAPAAAALSADAEGHRLEAAKEAAIDPAGLLISGAVGVAPGISSFLEKKLNVAKARAPHVEEAAKVRAVKDLGKDITSAEGAKSTTTDQKKIAEVNDRLYDLASENPELRRAFGESAEKALPKVRAFKEQLARPLDKLYDAVDANTNGGLAPSEVVSDLRAMAKQAAKRVSGLDDAARLDKLADRFEKVYITDAEPVETTRTARNLSRGVPDASADYLPEPLPGHEPVVRDEKFYADAYDEFNGHAPTTVEHSPLGAEETGTEKTRKGGKTLPAAPVESAGNTDAIAQLKELQKHAKGVALDEINRQLGKLEGESIGTAKTELSERPLQAGVHIPTKVFRAEVTDLLKTSESVMGGLEGTPRHEALSKLYDAGKEILDKHLDNSGLPPKALAQIRDINNGYFLLTRAESAIESRGWKEKNRDGFHFAHTARQALHGGLVPMAAYGMANPHAIPYMAGAAAMTKALPAAAKQLNWSMANGGYSRAIDRLIGLAKTVPKVEFIAQAARAGMGPAAARRIYDAAHKDKAATQ